MDKKSASHDREKKPREPKISRTLIPPDLSPVEWQRRLRRQFGREQKFELENVGSDPVFSDFWVENPQSKSAYRVEIRGAFPGDNRCSCPDFRTNELGTCKHIEFVLYALEGVPGAQEALARGYRPPFSEIVLRNDQGLHLCFRAGSECPPSVLSEARRLFGEEKDGRIPPDLYGEVEGFLSFAHGKGHEVRADDDALDLLAGQRDARFRSDRLDALFPGGEGSDRLSGLLSVPLYPYQVDGALFAVRTGRVLIGDEMGLGKTIQAIAAAEILSRHFGVTKVLVVCPTSLKYQWQSEIKKFAGRESRVIAGGRIPRERAYREEDFVKITNYEKLSPDLDLIAGWSPDLVIVDEAQRVKNWNTIASRALKRIDSPYAIVLTGTPLENKLEELVSIVQFVDRYRLGPTWKLLHEHQVKDASGRVVGYKDLEKIGQTLAPVMLRRKKAEVLGQLPERTDSNILVPMTDPQIRIHDENAEIVAEIGRRWRKTGYLSEVDQRRLTCSLQNMRMVCNSTYLLDQESDHGVKADELAALLEGHMASPEAKAVVFSQWTRSHDIIVRRLEDRGIGFVRFHGGIPSDRRPALVERFREDPDCRVFLSTDAGASGLNLQHATLLVNMDLPWNPAILEQRIARIHRMGQKRPVSIVNFVAKGGIEEGMLGVLSFKQSLAEGILDGGAGEISLGGSRLSRFMKEIEEVTGKIGSAEAVAPGEEIGAPSPPPAGEALSEEREEAPEPFEEIPPREGEGAPSEGAGSQGAAADPWGALAGLGSLLAGALAAVRDPEGAEAKGFVERDPRTGRAHVKIPLPPPETAVRIGEALGALAEVLKGFGR